MGVKKPVESTAVATVDRRLLIADLAYLGDTLMTTPVITNLRRNHPNAVIDFLASSDSAVVVRHNQDLNQVLEVDKDRFRKGSDLDYFLALVNRLKAKRYDTAFIVHRATRTALLAWMARIPQRIGLATQGRKLLLTRAVPLNIEDHRTDSALSLLTAVGERVTTRALTFTPAPGSGQRAEGLLDRAGWDFAHPLVGLSPGGSWKTKRWPEARFAKLVDRLAEAGAVAALVGGPGDRELAEEVKRQSGVPVLDLVGQTGFDELYEVFRRCAAVVANDSGPMHLAAAAGIPLVGLYGPTNPTRCGPISEAAVTVAGEVPCLGCYFKHCDHHSCMAYLAVPQVLAAIDGAVKKVRPPVVAEVEM